MGVEMSSLRDLYNNNNVWLYGISQDKYRNYFVEIKETENAQKTWDFNTADETIFEEYKELFKTRFDEDFGRKMVDEQTVTINGQKFFKLEYTGSGNGIYLMTVKNGVEYSMTISSKTLVDESVRISADDIFNTIRIHKTIKQEKSRFDQLFPIVMIAIAGIVVVVILIIVIRKLLSRKKAQRDKANYTPIFDDDEFDE